MGCGTPHQATDALRACDLPLDDHILDGGGPRQIADEATQSRSGAIDGCPNTKAGKIGVGHAPAEAAGVLVRDDRRRNEHVVDRPLDHVTNDAAHLLRPLEPSLDRHVRYLERTPRLDESDDPSHALTPLYLGIDVDTPHDGFAGVQRDAHDPSDPDQA
ncbi:MAG: hypothetical protein RI554_06325 [Trueperaceae bacterium]|nr:hypothetical protein [Trueperaceae bacterium]